MAVNSKAGIRLGGHARLSRSYRGGHGARIMLRRSCALELDTRRSNHLAPFIVFSGEEFSELEG